MSDNSGSAQPAIAPAESMPPASPAVARCAEAYSKAWNVERATTRDQLFAMREARKAYRAALPPLVGHENIRDFIACIAHAMLINAIDNDDASKLLYAAQVALSAARTQPAPAKSRSV